MSDSLWPHGLQHSRPLCPSPSPEVCPSSCLLHWWCHAAISSPDIPFFFCPQSFPASGTFPMSCLYQMAKILEFLHVFPLWLSPWLQMPGEWLLLLDWEVLGTNASCYVSSIYSHLRAWTKSVWVCGMWTLTQVFLLLHVHHPAQAPPPWCLLKHLCIHGYLSISISPPTSFSGLGALHLFIVHVYLYTLATCCKEPTHLKRPWCWEWLKAGGEGNDRGWDGWMASPTQWTCIWVSSGSWWWTGRPGVLQSLGLQRDGHNRATELNWTEYIITQIFIEHFLLSI